MNYGKQRLSKKRRLGLWGVCALMAPLLVASLTFFAPPAGAQVYGPSDLGYGPLGSAPAASGGDGNQRQVVFWKGTDGNLYESYWAPGVWSPTPIDLGYGRLGSQPTVIDAGGDAYVFWEGTDGNLYQAYGPDDGIGWPSQASDLGYGPLGSAPTAAGGDGSQQQVVFWRGTDANLYEVDWAPGHWSASPMDLGYGPLGSAPTAICAFPTTSSTTCQSFVFWKGYGGNSDLYQGYQSSNQPGSAWYGPIDLGFGPLGSAPTAVGGDGYQRQDVFWQGSGSGADLWEAYWTPGSWQGPIDRGMGPLGSQPGAIYSLTTSQAFVFWQGAGGGADLWQAYGDM